MGVRIRRPGFMLCRSLCTEILRILFHSNSHMQRIIVSCFVRVRNEVSAREHKLQIFGNKVFMKIFTPKTGEDIAQ
jgi:hypothetical protein